jgi:hypothetical protein
MATAMFEVLFNTDLLKHKKWYFYTNGIVKLKLNEIRGA